MSQKASLKYLKESKGGVKSKIVRPDLFDGYLIAKREKKFVNHQYLLRKQGDRLVISLNLDLQRQLAASFRSSF